MSAAGLPFSSGRSRRISASVPASLLLAGLLRRRLCQLFRRSAAGQVERGQESPRVLEGPAAAGGSGLPPRLHGLHQQLAGRLGAEQARDVEQDEAPRRKEGPIQERVGDALRRRVVFELQDFDAALAERLSRPRRRLLDEKLDATRDEHDGRSLVKGGDDGVLRC